MLESLTIGIVTFNSENTVIQTIQSLLDFQPDGIEMHIYVFDNASTDHTRELLSSWFDAHPQVSLEFNDSNIGFGRGNNKILSNVSSTWHCLCNPDIVIDQQTFKNMLKQIRQCEKIGILCPKFVSFDGHLQPLNKRSPILFDLFIRRFAPAWLLHHFERRLEVYEMRDVGYSEQCDVQFASGAFMLCRTTALKAIGGFDERYFLYFEDADLSRKMWGAGWRVRFEPSALVFHGWSRESHKNFSGLKLFIISGFKYFQKWGWRFFR